MTALWPWLAVAGLGALHGLNPCTGWGLAAACGGRAGDRRRALRALAPIAIGHAVSIAAVAATVALGASTDTGPLQRGAAAVLGAVLLAAGAARLRRRRVPGASPGGGTRAAGLALWSFVVSTAHGTGLMLVPALVPLCLAASPARALTASGSMGVALAAVAVHLGAMLAVTGLVATCACNGLRVMDAWRAWRIGRGRGADTPRGRQ